MNPTFIEKADEAERAVLSALYIDLPRAGAAVAEARLTAESFVSIERKNVFNVLMSLWNLGQNADAAILINGLRVFGDQQKPEDLIPMLESWGTAQGIEHHIQRLTQCRAARELYRLGDSLSRKAYDVTEDIEETLQRARSEIGRITTQTEVENTSFRHHLESVITGIEEVAEPKNAIELGLGLDETAGPFCRTDLVIVAGETGRGKSALAGNIVEHVASNGFKCALFSLEMSGAQVTERMLASQACVDMRAFKLSRRRLGDDAVSLQENMTFRLLTNAISRIKGWPIEIIERAFSLPQIMAVCRRLKSSSGLDLAVVDYAQLVHGIRDPGDNREREVASISRGMKRIAQELDCIVLLLSQLNEEGKLRESRALGQDANCVLFLGGDNDKMRVKVGKARSAPSGDSAEIPLVWRPTFTRFDRKKD